MSWRAPAFWQTGGILAAVLGPVGALYGLAAGRRMTQPGARASIPVICVGNFTAGGAGKTPTAIAVAELLRRAGRRPVFLTRGYGGSVREPTLVDRTRHRADRVGDEPLLLARHAPTVVSPDRVQGAALAAAVGDILVMDDGLQNPALEKDLSIAVVDGGSGVGNGSCIPAGPLRAPLGLQLQRIDAVLVIGQGEPGEEVARQARARGIPVFHGALLPESSAARPLAGRRVLAFAGIGRPEKFFETLAQCGAQVAERHAFPDHHPFTRSDVAGLIARAERLGAALVTTEKDRVRLEGVLAPGESERIGVLPVRLVTEDEAGLARLMAGKVRLSA